MVRTHARRRAPLILLLALIAGAIVVVTAAVGNAAPGDDTIILRVEGHAATVTFGENAPQELTNSGSRCRITSGLDGPILDFEAKTFNWRGHERNGYVGISDSSLGVNKSGRGSSHYCRKIDYLGHGRSEMLTISLGDLPMAEDKLFSSLDLSLRAWYPATAQVTFYLDGHEVGSHVRNLRRGITAVSVSPGEGVLFDAFKLSSRHGSFGVNGANVFHLEQLTIDPEISTSATAEVTVGEDIFDTATVSSPKGPTGQVTFRIYSDSDCESLVATRTGTLVEGVATSAAYTTESGGTYYWIATYEGDDLHNPVSGSCGDEGETTVVNPVDASLDSTATEVVTVGQDIENTVTVSGFGTPTGTVDFALYLGSCANLVASFDDVPLSGGTATSPTYMTESVGTYLWFVSYSGDASNNPVINGCDVEEPVSDDESEAEPAEPTLEVIADETDEIIGAPISASGILDEGFEPGGSIDFVLYTTATCDAGSEVAGVASTVPVDGNGTYSTPNFDSSSVGVGSFFWGATYSGDDNNDGESDCGAEVQIYQVGVECEAGFSAGGATGDVATGASFERGEKSDGEDSCELGGGVIPVTLEIGPSDVLFDFPTNTTYPGARFVVKIEWNPSDPIVDPNNPPVREVDYELDGTFVTVVACSSSTAPLNATPSIDFEYGHPAGAPVCLAGQELLLTQQGWQQVQYYDVLFDPKWR